MKLTKAMEEHFLTKIQDLPGNRRHEKYEVLHREDGWAVLKGGKDTVPFKFVLLCQVCEDHSVGDLEVGDVFARFALDIPGLKVRMQSMARPNQIAMYLKHVKSFIPHYTPEVCEEEDEAEKKRIAAQKKRAARRAKAKKAEAEARKEITLKYRKKYVNALIAGDKKKAESIRKAMIAELESLGLL